MDRCVDLNHLSICLKSLSSQCPITPISLWAYLERNHPLMLDRLQRWQKVCLNNLWILAVQIQPPSSAGLDWKILMVFFKQTWKFFARLHCDTPADHKRWLHLFLFPKGQPQQFSDTQYFQAIGYLFWFWNFCFYMY